MGFLVLALGPPTGAAQPCATGRLAEGLGHGPP